MTIAAYTGLMSPGTNFMTNTLNDVTTPRLETHWSRLFYVDLFAAEPARRLDSPPRGDGRVSEHTDYVGPDATSLWASALAWFGVPRKVRTTSVNSMAD